MIKWFLNGVGFGFGFCLAVAIVFWALSYIDDPSGEFVFHSSLDQEADYKERNQWRDLAIDEKIDRATAIAILRFRKEPDGLNAAYVEEIVRRDPDTELAIDVGDRLERSDFYSQGGSSQDRNGVVIFFVRNPGVEIEQGYLYDDRLIGEGGMPLQLFIEKFK